MYKHPNENIQTGGAALIVDYGQDFAVDDSLRGFYKHTQVEPSSLVTLLWYPRSLFMITVTYIRRSIYYLNQAE